MKIPIIKQPRKFLNWEEEVKLKAEKESEVEWARTPKETWKTYPVKVEKVKTNVLAYVWSLSRQIIP